jgi:two-component system, NarL family, invasion response regulator UvrY
MSRVRLLLVDDHAVVRTGYRALLQDSAVEVVGEAADGSAACQQYLALAPDVVVMDLSLPGIGGLEAIRRIVARDPGARILVFSIHDDVAFVEQTLRAGARGYITKSSAAEVLVEAVCEVASGGIYLDRSLAQGLALRQAHGQEGELSTLSVREFEIFCLLAEGSATATIARRLSLSHKTVANYATQIKRKLNLQSTAELVHLAIRHGIVSNSGLAHGRDDGNRSGKASG